MSNLRSDCLALVKELPPGDTWKVHIEALCYQIDTLEAYGQAVTREKNTAVSLLKEAHIDQIGGVPDLFYPLDGWEKWYEKIDDLTQSCQRTREGCSQTFTIRC